MLGREDLDVNKLVYATDIDTMLVDCEGTEVWPQDSDGCEYYFKSQADKVMDAMEARIKELEAQLPKWISVKDRLPDEEKPYIIYVKGHQGAGDEQMIVYWDASRRDFCVGEEGWPIDGEYSEVTHWQPLPQPPTTEKM